MNIMSVLHMRCWVSNRVKGCVEFIYKGIFGKYSKMKILGLKRSNLYAFFRPSALKTEKKGYVYIEESFDTIFNMGYGRKDLADAVHICGEFWDTQ